VHRHADARAGVNLALAQLAPMYAELHVLRAAQRWVGGPDEAARRASSTTLVHLLGVNDRLRLVEVGSRTHSIPSPEAVV
jgi:hypothetical protein